MGVFAYTHEVPSNFTTKYPTKKTLQLVSTFPRLLQRSTPRLGFLKMGIMMPETCWESVDNNHLTVASCWFSLALHILLTMHGHRNLKLVKTCYNDTSHGSVRSEPQCARMCMWWRTLHLRSVFLYWIVCNSVLGLNWWKDSRVRFAEEMPTYSCRCRYSGLRTAELTLKYSV